MANRDFHKNLILALGALGAIFGGVQKSSGIDTKSLYNEANEINFYNYQNNDEKYDKAIQLIRKLKTDRVVPTSRKNQSLKHTSTDLAKAKFLYESSKAILNFATSLDPYRKIGMVMEPQTGYWKK